MRTGYIYYPEAEQVLEEIKSKCELHHVSLANRYHSKKAVTINEYNGKFGKGFTVERTSARSNNYHDIMYYILKG